MKAGEGRLLVRASVTILCVRIGMSLTRPALNTSPTADVDAMFLQWRAQWTDDQNLVEYAAPLSGDMW